MTRVQTCLSPVTPLTPPDDGMQRCARCGWPIRLIAGSRDFAHVTTEARKAEAARRLAEANRNGIDDSWWEGS